MSSNEASGYRLSPKALEDMEDIWRYTAENWSLEQADQYIDDLEKAIQLIVSMPLTARERMELNPPVRIHVHQTHLVVYTLGDKEVIILRVLGGRQNWQEILKNTE